MANTYIQNSFGQVLTIATGIDLSGNTGLSLHFRKPSGTTVDITSNVAVSGDAADGNVTYTATENDALWSEDGTVLCTPKVTFASASHEGATPVEFTVYRRNQER